MLPEYAICMSLVRSTSAALCICDIGSVSFSDRSNGENDNETAEHRKHTLANGCQRPAALWKRLTINDVVDILCYVWYLPLFLAGPLMTCENFCRQVLSSRALIIMYNGIQRPFSVGSHRLGISAHCYECIALCN